MLRSRLCETVEIKTIVNYLLLLIMGSLLFDCYIGLEFIDPQYVQWLLVKNDPVNHLLGWTAYLFSDCTEVFGNCLMQTPLGVGVGQTDSIPLMAVIAKFLFGRSHGNFQYFGIYLYFCFLLLGLVAFWACFRKTKDLPFSFLSAGLMWVSFVLLGRLETATAHIALTCHFLILLLIVFWTDDHRSRGDSSLTLGLSFLPMVISSLIHPTIWVILTSIQVPLSLFSGWKYGRIRAPILFTAISFGVSITLMKACGFLGPHSGEAPDFGVYSANLVSFFDSNGHSLFLGDLVNGKGQIEGYSYLGFGFISLICFLLGPSRIFAKKRIHLEFQVNHRWLVTGICLILFLFSLSRFVAAGPELVFDLSFVYKYLSFVTGALRSSGRFIWPMAYLIMWSVISAISQFKKKRLILLVGLSLQLVDSIPLVGTRRPTTWPKLAENQTVDTGIEKLLKNPQRPKVIEFLPPVLYDVELAQGCKDLAQISLADYTTISLQAFELQVPTNSGIVSRGSPDFVDNQCNHQIAMMRGEEPLAKGHLLVLNKETLAQFPGFTQSEHCEELAELKICWSADQ